jgi:tRNA dimethylallyltransferase
LSLSGCEPILCVAHTQYSSEKSDAGLVRHVSFDSLVRPLNPENSPLIVVLGPTGAGKSELALALAEAFVGEIVNFDSVQVFRGLDVGSAKVPEPERRGIPHHLIDVIGPEEELTAGGFSRLARCAITEITARGRLPVLVGGTGLYLRALLDGLSPAPERDEELRKRLTGVAGRRPGALHRFLRARDAEAGRRIHANDLQKLMRAIELTVSGGRPATETQSLPREALTGYSVLKIGLNPDRPALYDRLNRRSERMFAGGLLEETQVLLQSGVPTEAKSLSSLGYRQAVAVLTGRMSVEDAVRECQTKTRQYAKRQMTWFRAERDVRWLQGFGSDPAIQEQAVRFA